MKTPIGICWAGEFYKYKPCRYKSHYKPIEYKLYCSNWDENITIYEYRVRPMIGIIKNKSTYSVFKYTFSGNREVNSSEVYCTKEIAIMRGIERSLENVALSI